MDTPGHFSAVQRLRPNNAASTGAPVDVLTCTSFLGPRSKRIAQQGPVRVILPVDGAEYIRMPAAGPSPDFA